MIFTSTGSIHVDWAGRTVDHDGQIVKIKASRKISELAAKIGEAVKASKIMGEGAASEEDAPEETDEGNGSPP